VDVALDVAAGDDFETLGRYRTLDAAADHDVAGLDGALEVTRGADHHARFGIDVALDAAVDVQPVAQGEIADKLGAGCDDGGAITWTLLRTVLAKDCH